MEIKRQEIISMNLSQTVLSFLRKHGWQLLLAVGCSTIFVAAVFVFVYLVAPAKTIYQQDLTILLPQDQDRNYIYPSGNVFDRNDIVSSSILDIVYQKCNLANVTDANLFEERFGAVMTESPESMKVEAIYRSKLARRNATLSDIETIQKEYIEQRSHLPPQRVTITFDAPATIPRPTAERVLSVVPDFWARVYNQIEGIPLPPCETSEQVRKFISNGDCGLLELLHMHEYAEDIIARIKCLQKKTTNKEFNLTNGVTLGNLQRRLEFLVSYQMDPLLISSFSDSKSRDYLERKIFDLKTRISLMEENVEKAHKLYMQLSKNDVSGLGGKTSEKDIQLSLTLDKDFFSKYESLVMKSKMEEALQPLVSLIIKKNDELRDLEEQLLKYQNMMPQETNGGKTLVPKTDMNEMGLTIKKIAEEVLSIGENVEKFQEIIMSDYANQNKFFTLSGAIRRTRFIAWLPVKKLVLSFVVLWVILNGFVAVKMVIRSDCQ